MHAHPSGRLNGDDMYSGGAVTQAHVTAHLHVVQGATTDSLAQVFVAQGRGFGMMSQASTKQSVGAVLGASGSASCAWWIKAHQPTTARLTRCACLILLSSTGQAS